MDATAHLSDSEVCEQTEAVRELPFVDENLDGELLFWIAEPTGDQARDIQLGEWFADLALDVVRRYDLPLLLATILRDMTLAGGFTGVEAGFVNKIASAARSGSMH